MNISKSSRKIHYPNTLYRFLSRKLHRNSIPRSIILYLSISFALICWILVLTQFISQNTITSQDAIPAYKTQYDTSSKILSSADINSFVTFPQNTTLSFTNTNFFNENTTSKVNTQAQQLLNYLKKGDKDICCVFSHKEKNYTDYYFFSPALAACIKARTNQNFNLQIAVTKNTVYLGIPFIRTSF